MLRVEDTHIYIYTPYRSIFVYISSLEDTTHTLKFCSIASLHKFALIPALPLVCFSCWKKSFMKK